MAFLIGEISALVKAPPEQFRRDMGVVKREGARASQDVNRGLDGIGANLSRIGFLAKTVFASSLVVGARQAVREFALLEGAIAKFDVVFGDQAGMMNDWVDSFRQNVPLARREIIQAAGSMQDLLVPMGVARDEATGMTQQWLELGAALAAFNDVPMDRALEAIRSGIAGQTQPLRQFGINASVAALEQTALANGLMQAGEKMSDQVRQQALLIQAYAQSKDAVNGYADQLDSTLIKEQALGAAFKDTMAIIGRQLQPTYNALVTTLADLFTTINTGQNAATRRAVALQAELEKIREILSGDVGDMNLAQLERSLAIVKEQMDKLASRRHMSDEQKANLEMLIAMHGNLIDAIQAVGEQSDKTNTSMAQMPMTVGDLRERIKELEEAIDDSFDRNEIIAYQDEIEVLQKKIDNLLGAFRRFETEDVVSEVIDNFEELSTIADDLEKAIGDLDFKEHFDAQSVIMLRAELEELQHQMERSVDPERTRELQLEIEALQERIRELIHGTDELGASLDRSTGAARFFSTTLADGIEKAIFQAQSLSDALNNIIRQLASRALTTGLMMLFGGGLPQGMNFISAMFGGFRAGGGGVTAGRPYMVGERGAEMFIPSGSGTIVPNHQLQGGDMDQVVSALNKMVLRTQVTGKIQGEDIFITSVRGQNSFGR